MLPIQIFQVEHKKGTLLCEPPIICEVEQDGNHLIARNDTFNICEILDMTTKHSGVDKVIPHQKDIQKLKTMVESVLNFYWQEYVLAAPGSVTMDAQILASNLKCRMRNVI